MSYHLIFSEWYTFRLQESSLSDSTSGYRNARHKWYGTCQTTPGYDDDLLIIFTTSYPEYMHESFEVQPFQFITKPVDYTAIYKLFNNIIKNYIETQKYRYNWYWWWKNFVPLSDLLYISSMKENKLHLRYQLTDRALISKGTLSEAEKRLSSHGFVSPSRGFLVNLHQIRSITSTRLLLNNGFELPISRRRSKELQNIYSQHIINIL